MARRTLEYALYLGSAYFIAMATAHFFGIKVPLLFVYWDTPYFAYQDKIIAFTVLTYAALFFTAARHRIAVPAALFSIVSTVLGLALVNSSDALSVAMAGGEVTTGQWRLSWSAIDEDNGNELRLWPYWAQTLLLGAYAVLLLTLYITSRERQAG